MPLPEPDNTLQLWERVKLQGGWPDGNEDVVRELAAAWAGAATLFAGGSVIAVADLENAWRDGAGRGLASSVQVMLDRSGRVEVGATQQQVALLAYADIVQNAKALIRDTIARNIPIYAHIRTIDASFLPEGDADFVTGVAGMVNETLDAAVAAAANIRAGVATQGSAGAGYTEFGTINDFIHDELVTNARSADVAEIRALATSGNPASGIEAAALWAEKVKTGGDWDHKPDIGGIPVGDNNFTPVPGGDGSIRYDFWSNLHYGYVGVEAGFDEWTLVTGANAVDLKENGSTDPADELAIRINVELREKYGPEALRPEHVEQAIEDHYDELVASRASGPTRDGGGNPAAAAHALRS